MRRTQVCKGSGSVVDASDQVPGQIESGIDFEMRIAEPRLNMLASTSAPIFAVEDGIEARRDALIAALQKRLHRATRDKPPTCR